MFLGNSPKSCILISEVLFVNFMVSVLTLKTFLFLFSRRKEREEEEAKEKDNPTKKKRRRAIPHRQNLSSNSAIEAMEKIIHVC